MSDPTPTRKRADVQGLRAVAVLMVVIYHAKLPLPAGFAGVDMFFVISGFVITGQIERVRAAGRFSFAVFYARRVRRLLPALTIVLLVTLLMSFFVESPLDGQAKTAATALAAAQMHGNLEILASTGGYFAAAATTNPLLHMWSLNVEEQFYLVFPALVVLAGRRRRLLVPVLAVCTLASLAACLWLAYGDFQVGGHPSADVAFYSPLTRAWEFGVGALLALVAPRAKLPMHRVVSVIAVVLLAGLNLTADELTTWPGVMTLVPVLATGLLLLAGAHETGPVQRVLGSRPFRVTGDLSYSVYLWHWPFIVMATLLWPGSWVPVVAAVGSVVPAWLSYRFVEQPVRTGRIVLVRDYAAGLLTVGVVAGAATLLPVAGLAAVPHSREYARQQGELTYGRQTGCFLEKRAFRATDLTKCRDRVENSRGWVMLAGDSHAESLSSGLIAADRRLGYDTEAVTGASCQFSRTATPEAAECGKLTAALLDQVHGDDPPSLVVVTQWSMPRQRVDPSWPEPIRPALEEITRAGIPVVYVLDVPNFAPELIRLTACSGGAVLFTCDKPEDAVLAYQRDSRRADRALVSGLPGVTLVDPWPRFCTGTTCSALVDGKLAYTDFHHLNRIGSLALTGTLEAAVAQEIS